MIFWNSAPATRVVDRGGPCLVSTRYLDDDVASFVSKCVDHCLLALVAVTLDAKLVCLDCRCVSGSCHRTLPPLPSFPCVKGALPPLCFGCLSHGCCERSGSKFTNYRSGEVKSGLSQLHEIQSTRRVSGIILGSGRRAWPMPTERLSMGQPVAPNRTEQLWKECVRTKCVKVRYGVNRW